MVTWNPGVGRAEPAVIGHTVVRHDLEIAVIVTGAGSGIGRAAVDERPRPERPVRGGCAGGAAWALLASWQTTSGGGAATVPMEMCLANTLASAADLGAWLDGQGSGDP